MDWVLMALVLGAALYSVQILTRFLEHQRSILPAIGELVETAGKLEVEAQTEAVLRDEVRLHLPPLKQLIGDHQKKITTLQDRLAIEQKRSRRLQMESNRVALKNRRREQVS